MQSPTEHDLVTGADIHDLVVAFYREIMLDELLEPIFGDIAEVDWVEHIPRLIDYWRWILLGTPGYSGTVTKTHRHLHGLHALEGEHCDRWFALWVLCVDQRWAGRNAERAKHHAEMVMTGLARRVFGFAWAPPSSPPLPQLDATTRDAPLR
ncbi:MAG TPA: group III truncated hemoglobin [Acidimicrobiia bacterium]|jgi:hemoglobin